jgi:hypothetical protein
MLADLTQNCRLNGTVRSALGDDEASRKRYDKRRNLCDEAIANGQFREDVRGFPQRHPMPKRRDENTTEDIDARDDETRDRIAAHELRGAVHGAEKRAFLFEFTPAALRLALIDQAGR